MVKAAQKCTESGGNCNASFYCGIQDDANKEAVGDGGHSFGVTKGFLCKNSVSFFQRISLDFIIFSVGFTTPSHTKNLATRSISNSINISSLKQYSINSSS